MPLLNVGFVNFKNFKRDAEQIAISPTQAALDSLAQQLNPARIVDYPTPLNLAIGAKWRDHFARASLTPAGFPTIYTTNGTISFVSGGTTVRAQTGAVIGNSAFIFMNNLGFARGIEGITSIKATIVTTPANSLANCQSFSGIYVLDGVTGALPTLQHHCGVEYDSVVSPNWRTTSAGVIEQLINTSTLAYTIASHTIVITWTATSVIFEVDGNVIGTHNSLLSLPASANGYGLYSLVITQAASAKFLDLDKWTLEFL